MQIFDTLKNKKTGLKFSDKVRIYLCGMTVYDDAHIGHARTIIVFDVLRRFLESQKIPVELVQNFTDVDDKIIQRAQEEKTPSLEIVERYTKSYFDDFDGLNVRRATRYPKAREHIQDMQNLISDLIEKGYAYIKKDGVYFSVSKFDGYGKLSKKKLESDSKKIDEKTWLHECTRCGHKWKTTGRKLKDGWKEIPPKICDNTSCRSQYWNKPLVSVVQRASVAAFKQADKKFKEQKTFGGANSENQKKNQIALDEAREKIKAEEEQKTDIQDFALWKFSDFSITWDSPWGKGRPGWHIECSAMSLKYLGENFEIHGGGRDLIFPHHENEIAQSESSTSKQFAKIWMHVGMVTINKQKMSKSIGNVRTISYVLENWGPNIIRLFCLAGHYTKPIDYSEKLLKEKITRLRQIESCYYELRLAVGTDGETIAKKLVKTYSEEFNSALNDDLNTPLALAAYYKLISKVNSLAAEEKITQTSAEIILPEFERMSEILGIQITKVSDVEINEINEMIKKRDEYRIQKNYKQADSIRTKIAEKGIIFIDHKNKTAWVNQEKIKAE